MKFLPIEVFLLNFIFNPHQELQPIDDDLSELKKSQYLSNSFYNNTQFSLADSFSQQGPIVVMAAESRRRSSDTSPSRHCDVSDNIQGISRPGSPEVALEHLDEIEGNENVVTDSSTITYNTNFTSQVIR